MTFGNIETEGDLPNTPVGSEPSKASWGDGELTSRKPKPDKSGLERMDAFLRNPDKLFAKLADALCPYKGEDYLNSNVKRMLDLGLAVPAACVSIGPLVAIGFAVPFEDGGEAFFVQERVSNDLEHTFKVIKLRSMRPDADKGIESFGIAEGLRGDEDPRNTKIGAFMRRFNIDELPQFLQIVLGQMSLVGIRPNTPYGMEYLSQVWSPERYARWLETYKKTNLGLTGVNQILTDNKVEGRRYHADRFYVENASLGLDLYLIWRTALKMIKQLQGL